MKKKEYQIGTVTFTKVEEGWLSSWLAERTATGWTLKTTERYFSSVTLSPVFQGLFSVDFS